MERKSEKIIRSTQEQAVASWITHLNQIRLDNLIRRLDEQSICLDDAINELNELKKFIASPENILGNKFTKHGEIAEHMQVNFANARQLIKGLSKSHSFEGVGRTAPEDYLRGDAQIQSKFYNGLKATFFNHHGVKDHLEMYPDFLKKGGSYDIPRDQFQKMTEILEKYKTHPSELSTGDYNLAKKLDGFLNENGLVLGKDIQPSISSYAEVQQFSAENTIRNEEKSIRKENQERRKDAYTESKPTLKEGVKAAGVSAILEGATAFTMTLINKKRSKKFSEFTAEDWQEIGFNTGAGTIKGGIRGGTIYALTNYTATPGSVASAYTTAIFGIASQVKALNRGEVTEEEFYINCETVCLDVSISAISSLAGQVLIPIPVVGAVIGNITGEFIYEFCKQEGNERAQKIIAGYNSEMNELIKDLDAQYLNVVLEIQQSLKRFMELKDLAFSEDVNVAFEGATLLAEEVGVSEEFILQTLDDTDNYFLM